MPNDNILHNDIRVFKSKPDGPVVEISKPTLVIEAGGLISDFDHE